MLYSFCRFWIIVVLRLFFHFKIEGLEHIPKRGGFILASNHVSYLDPPVIGAACSRKLNYMAKQELFRNPLISWFLHAVYAFPVKRDSADLSAIKEAMHRVKSGKGLVLFPEGSRRFDSQNSEPYAGIGFLSAKLDVPVIPAFISGTEKALPRQAKFFKAASISVRFGKQIPIERRVPYQETAIQIMDNIRHLSCEESN